MQIVKYLVKGVTMQYIGGRWFEKSCYFPVNNNASCRSKLGSYVLGN